MTVLAPVRVMADGVPWVDAGGRPTADAREALALLTAAGEDGLDPADYDAAPLAARAALLEGSTATPAPTDAPAAAARFATALDAAMVRFLRELHEGRIDPLAMGYPMEPRRDRHDFAGLLHEAAAAHRLPALVAELRPQVPLYAGLRAALPRYRALAADRALAAPLPPLPRALHIGDAWDGLPALAARLAAEGDLAAADAATPPTVYAGELVGAVQRFQDRHGLAADGVLGRSTLAALAVPLAQRARQIELAMERLRWLPHPTTERLLVVNIPMFRLVGWGPPPRTASPDLRMAVVVGRAIRHQTPVLVETLRRVIFRPYWNVPVSIARAEILPALARDPSYLRRHDMEIVAGESDAARVLPVDAASVAGVRAGRLRVRQRPGPSNSLGLVKFVFPNAADVYLHGTPAQELFRRSRRDFSHGCVRVEDPVALAAWVLAPEGGWTRERILAAMGDSRTQQVELAHPIQVLLFYVTAVAGDGGAVRFADDVYGHDARLAAALAAR